MEKDTKHHLILYWFGVMDEGEEIMFHLIFNGKHDIVSSTIAELAMGDAKYLMYPIICLN